jgi:hypothetical protein
MKLLGSTKKSSEQIILGYSCELPESRGPDSTKGVGLQCPLLHHKNLHQARSALDCIFENLA